MLTAQNIKSQQFHVRFRGFDVDEVDDFLEQIATVVQALNEENRMLHEKLELAEQMVEKSQRQEKVAMNAILSAQTIAQEMKEKAREALTEAQAEAQEVRVKAQKEAGEIRVKAQKEAREIRAKVQAEAREIEESTGREIADLEQQVDRLKEMTNLVRQDIRQLLASYLAKLELDQDQPTPISQSSQVGSFVGLGGTTLATTAATDQTPTSPATKFAERNQSMELSEGLRLPVAEQEASPVSEMPETTSGYREGLDPDSTQKAKLTTGSEPLAPDSTSILPRLNEWVLPDLGDDMVFNLEDPLDAIDEEEAEEAEEAEYPANREPTINLDDKIRNKS